MNSLEVGPLYLMFMRTVRVKALDTSNLPPGLGTMDIYPVSDYEKNCPKNWDKEGYFIAMHDTEAMWMNFQCCTPVAVLISAGGINALSGEKSDNKLVKDNYLVTPPQPWLDGWKSDDGSVYQFVSTNAGEGLSVGEQLIDTQDHGMQISVFEPKNPEKMHSTTKSWDSDAGLEGAVACCSMSKGIQLQSLCSFTASEMSMGKGGKITQKIYEDPHGIEEWKETPTKTVKVYLINAAQFAEITGTQMPPAPVSTDYQGPWFNLIDGHMKDIAGTKIFDALEKTS